MSTNDPFDQWASNYQEWDELPELPDNAGINSDEERSIPPAEAESHAQPTMEELFSHANDDDELDEQFSDFMDTLPDPNATSLWEGKLDDLQLQLRGLVTNEVFQNFVDGHYPEWMPRAEEFATMEAYNAARRRAIVKIKYLISFSVTLMSLAEKHLRDTRGE